MAYYTIGNVTHSESAHVYTHVALWAAGSHLHVALMMWRLNLWADRILPFLGAVAAGLYYWFAALFIAITLGVAGIGTLLLRAAAFALIGVWLTRALRLPRPHHDLPMMTIHPSERIS